MSNSPSEGEQLPDFAALSFMSGSAKSLQQVVNTKFTLPACWACNHFACRARPSIETCTGSVEAFAAFKNTRFNFALTCPVSSLRKSVRADFHL
jgi:hypothetical protein